MTAGCLSDVKPICTARRKAAARIAPLRAISSVG
jgi:hypothetical protein